MHSLRNRNTCQVCKKSFSNASALSDHMASHTKRISARNAGSASGSTLPSLEASNKVGPNFNPHETVLVRSNQTSEVGVKQDLKGKRNMIVDEGDSTGSRGSLTADEEAALCLVAMSKGQRPENSQTWSATPNGQEEYYETDFDSDGDDKNVKSKSLAELLTSDVETRTHNKEDEHADNEDKDEDEDEGEDEDYEDDDAEDADDDDDDNDEDDDDEALVARENKCKKKIECEGCGKVFGSYQALGGHRSRQRCKKDQDQRYKCDVCGRGFESCQALGGHMKGHYK